MSRVIVLISTLLLSACAKPSAEQDMSCQAYAGAYSEQYPDGLYRKSDVSLCSDGCNHISSVDDPNVSFKECQ